MVRLLRCLLMLPAVLVLCSGCRQTLPGIILDTDISNDIDDVECLDIVCKYADAGKADFLALMLSKEGSPVAEAADLYTTWYGYPDVPIGIVKGSPAEDVPYQYIHAVLDTLDKTGAPVFARSRGDYDALPEAWKLYRKVLSSRPDKSVTIVAVGFSTNLSRLLASLPDEYSPLNGEELVRRKVKSLVMMAGRFTGDGGREYNIIKDAAAARRVFENWPTPVAVSPWELGEATLYPVERLAEDFKWTKYHPFVISYKAYRAMPYRNNMFDPTAVLYALEGDCGGLFNVSAKGTVSVAEDGLTTYTEEPAGKHVILSADSLQREGLASTIADILARRPSVHAERALRGKADIIFETDMGNDVDDVLALDMIHKYVDDGAAQLLAVMLNKETPQAPEFVDRVDTWYGRSDIPVGIIKDGPQCDQDDYCKCVCAMKDASGNDLFPRSNESYDALLPAHILYRKVLSDRPDGSVTIVSVGFSTNLARLLATGPDEYSPLGGRDLVRCKVKEVVLTGGMFVPEDKPEFNIRKDVASARVLLEECPVPVIVSPGEVGSRVQYPAESILSDFGWASAHPVVESYKAYRPMPYDRNCWDLMAVLYAVEGGCSDYFNISPEGRIKVSDEGFTSFEYAPGAGVRYLQVQDEQVERIRARFIDLVTAKPKKYNKKLF